MDIAIYILENLDCSRVKIRPFDCPKIFSTHTQFSYDIYELPVSIKL